MKKLLILLFCFIISITNVTAQIIYNQMENDSTRIKCAGMTCCRSFTDTQVLNIGIQQVIVNNDTAYFVVICINQFKNSNIPDDGRILLKTKENEIIKLYNTESLKYKLVHDYGTTTTAYRVGRTINIKTQENKIVNNQIIGYYPIEESVLNKLFKGVTKVKIELTTKNYEKTFNKDKVGKALYKHYKELKYDTFKYKF